MSHPEVVVVEARTACDFALAAAVVEPVATIASAAIDAAAQTTDVNLFKLPHQESSDGLRRPDDSMTKVEILSRRALNRALLARQMLLQRAQIAAVDALEHLVGMQAQAPLAPYVGLWTRVEGFAPDELVTLLTSRAAVRIALMRSTIHLVTARDCFALRAVVQRPLIRHLTATYGNRLAGLDLDEVARAGRERVEEQPITLHALGRSLNELWPDRDPEALAIAVRNLVPLVQVPPRGIWGSGGVARHTSAEQWIGRSVDPDPSPNRMVRRYLTAFGPATIADVQNWSGVSGLKTTVEAMRPQLRAFRDEDGRTLFDVTEGLLPDAETPAPPRFLPEYDNALLGHADRTRIIDHADRSRVFTRGALLVDGFTSGAWRITRTTRTASLAIELFRRLPRREQAAVSDEGERLLGFAAPAATQRDILLTQP